MTVTAKTKRRYEAILVEVMSSIDDVRYAKDEEFTDEQLIRITPEEMVRYMCRKCFNQPNHPTTANLTYGRASSLEYYKKAVSYFMPNCVIQWNQREKEGNPTRSGQVSDWIALVEKSR